MRWTRHGKAGGFSDHWDTEALPERVQRCVGQRGHPHGAGWEFHPLGRWCGPHGSTSGGLIWRIWAQNDRNRETGCPSLFSSILCSLILFGQVEWRNHQQPWANMRRRLHLVLAAVVVAWRPNLATFSQIFSLCLFTAEECHRNMPHITGLQDLSRLQEWFMLDSSLADGNSLWTRAEDWYQTWCYRLVRSAQIWFISAVSFFVGIT